MSSAWRREVRSLLSVGRLVGHKDHATSIAAMASLARTSPLARLVIAGAGPLRSTLQAQIDSLGVARHVTLLGARTDVPALLRTADLFVFPSRFEGLGIALMEALAAGLPGVSSRIATSLEVADGSPAVRYFAPGDPEDLASVIRAALADLPAFSASARDGAPRIRDRFAPGVMAAQYGAVFRAAARPAPPPGPRAHEKSNSSARLQTEK